VVVAFFDVLTFAADSCASRKASDFACPFVVDDIESWDAADYDVEAYLGSSCSFALKSIMQLT
jgi:hypothetical protein